jgi:hypothetical protein
MNRIENLHQAKKTMSRNRLKHRYRNIRTRNRPFFKKEKPNLEIDEAKVGLIVLHPAHQNHVPQRIELGPARKQPVMYRYLNLTIKGKTMY